MAIVRASGLGLGSDVIQEENPHDRYRDVDEPSFEVEGERCHGSISFLKETPLREMPPAGWSTLRRPTHFSLSVKFRFARRHKPTSGRRGTGVGLP